MATLRTCHEERLAQREWTRRWLADDLDVGESVGTVRDRVLGATRRLAADHVPDETVLFVTSAVPVRLLACEALGAAIGETWFPVTNAALDWTDEGGDLVTLDDTSHLPDRLATQDGFVERE